MFAGGFSYILSDNFYYIKISRNTHADKNAIQSVSVITLNVSFQPLSRNITKNVATHGKYIAINTHATTNSAGGRLNGCNKAIDTSLRRQPKISKGVVSAGRPKICSTG